MKGYISRQDAMHPLDELRPETLKWLEAHPEDQSIVEEYNEAAFEYGWPYPDMPKWLLPRWGSEALLKIRGATK